MTIVNQNQMKTQEYENLRNQMQNQINMLAQQMNNQLHKNNSQENQQVMSYFNQQLQEQMEMKLNKQYQDIINIQDMKIKQIEQRIQTEKEQYYTKTDMIQDKLKQEQIEKMNESFKSGKKFRNRS